jgi:Nucleotidyl transferase AbiEii toxin, Type IV TA system
VKRGPTRNLSASVRTRLPSLAQGRGEDYQRVLGRYAIERFLYRLGRSKHRDKFALKGATLFTLWTGQTHRPTKDLDLLGRGLSSTITEIEALIGEICGIRQDDGIVFDDESIEGISDQRRGRIRWRTRQVSGRVGWSSNSDASRYRFWRCRLFRTRARLLSCAPPDGSTNHSCVPA